MSPTYRSFAKINLHLEVLGKREDGYHELRTVFQTVDLCDLLTIELTDGGVELDVEAENVPSGSENLAHKAASAFLERWAPARGARIRLRKTIPVGGGLGGGSSNAATVLLVLQELLDSPASGDELVSVARSLGADVPYFLVGGTAMGTGRGDEIEALEELPETEIWLVIPAVSISTAEVFAEFGKLTRKGGKSSIEHLAEGSISSWLASGNGWNDLQELVVRRYPGVGAVYNALREAGASEVKLSGSGATVFARFSDQSVSRELARHLPPTSDLVRARTLTRSSCQRLRLV
ncbi:MAG: 4-(cytidine 5'-diphospho)-2-C-methyl-D-erythritol kinase [Acidobacteria bacterium]|nr:MAG: 4-(cytidine 5'-diphospho)-2-C-methyl-D-erythritol kinase [Acidobacteriota bacterium]